VAGEPGGGTKRIITESLRGAAGPVAWGTCWPGDGAPPFWPWTQVLRSCLAFDPSRAAGAAGPLLGARAAVHRDASRFVLFESAVDLLRAVALMRGWSWSSTHARLANRFLARRVRRVTGAPLRDIGPMRAAHAG